MATNNPNNNMNDAARKNGAQNQPKKGKSNQPSPNRTNEGRPGSNAQPRQERRPGQGNK